MPKLSEARFTQGLCAYRTGEPLDKVSATLDAFEKMWDTLDPQATQAQREEIHNAVPSFLMGFAQGALEDIRAIKRRLAA